VHLLDVVQFALDEAMPVTISAQGGRFYVDDNTETPDTMLATFQYPGFIGCYESRTANALPIYNEGYGTAFHGTKATLVVNRGGYTIYPGKKGAEPVSENSKEMSTMNVPHWRNFQESIRSRQKPIADIETCVRTTATCVLANLAMRHHTTLDWDEKAFTVKQHEAKPWLKAKYRAPWKLEA
jgi:predicted dehydrogenase